MHLQTRTQFATILAIAMHLAGVMGILLGMDEWFAKLTPFNLLAMFVLLFWTLPERNTRMLLFFLVAAGTGLTCEMIGVKTGALFGTYQYSDILGLKINGVPLLIGITWFIVVYGSGMVAMELRQLIASFLPVSGKAIFSKWIGLSVIIDGALIATFFDWVMEPAAVKLGFWSWEGGQITMLNYLSWFLVSMLILFFFSRAKLKQHQFAVNLLLIQLLFFLIVR